MSAVVQCAMVRIFLRWRNVKPMGDRVVPALAFPRPRRRGGVVTQRPAKPRTPVRFRPSPWRKGLLERPFSLPADAWRSAVRVPTGYQYGASRLDFRANALPSDRGLSYSWSLDGLTR